MNCQLWLIASGWVSVRVLTTKSWPERHRFELFDFESSEEEKWITEKSHGAATADRRMLNINSIIPSVSIRCLSCCSSDLLIPANENDGRFLFCFTTELLTCGRNNSIKSELMIIGRKNVERENPKMIYWCGQSDTEDDTGWYGVVGEIQIIGVALHTLVALAANAVSMSTRRRRKQTENHWVLLKQVMDNSRPPSSRPMSLKANEMSSASSGRIGTASRLSALPSRMGTAKNIGIPQKVNYFLATAGF